jgi:hypothetical protein
MNFTKSNMMLIAGVLALIFGIVTIPMLVENLDAKEIMVIQYPMGGLEVFTTPGPKAQWFGKVTKYPRQSQYTFCSQIDQASKQEIVCPVQLVELNEFDSLKVVTRC